MISVVVFVVGALKEISIDRIAILIDNLGPFCNPLERSTNPKVGSYGLQTARSL